MRISVLTANYIGQAHTTVCLDHSLLVMDAPMQTDIVCRNINQLSVYQSFLGLATKLKWDIKHICDRIIK